MFNRYTEKARRVIFHARYEASMFGSPYIESEHLLLGLVNENHVLANRLVRAGKSVDEIRRHIELRTPTRATISTSVDLPLSNECKRILADAAEEAERAHHQHIGTEHLVAGVLREERCFAAELLRKYGVSLDDARNDIEGSRPDASWIGDPSVGLRAGFGSGRVRSTPGMHVPPRIEFVCDGKELLSSVVLGPPPRVGERVVFRREEQDKGYRVRDVTYRYDFPKEAPTPEQVAQPAGGAIFVTPVIAFRPAVIIVTLEHE